MFFKLGIRASSTCEVNLVDCRVHKSQIIGEVGKGYKIAIESLNEGRIGIGKEIAIRKSINQTSKK